MGQQDAQPAAVPTTQRKLQSILLVDDEASFRMLLRLALKQMPYQLFEAGSGQQALTLLRTLKPEVILLDICMPGIDGITLLRQIRETNQTSAIFMTSGLCTKEWIDAATAAGATGYLTKPFHFSDLQQTLNRLSNPHLSNPHLSNPHLSNTGQKHAGL
jgi:CheY-like chemotaxis protein